MQILPKALLVGVCLFILGFGINLHADNQAFVQNRYTLLPHNATSCVACHAVPAQGGSSKVVVERLGSSTVGPSEGAVSSRRPIRKEAFVASPRVALGTLGDAYVEVVPGQELQAIAAEQVLRTAGKIHGKTTWVSVPEASAGNKAIGRFGWKAQHASLISASAEALKSELGVSNKYFSTEGSPEMPPSSLRDDDKVEAIVDFLRSTQPILPSSEQGMTASAKAGSVLFDQVGCATCHVRTLTTAPAGTHMNGGTLVVSARLGSKAFHPFSDYLLHNVGTGDGVVQNIHPEDYDPSTANKFRTAPLWGVRFRSWLMHDGQSVTYHQAIMRHAGEASEVVKNYLRLTPVQKEQLRQFLESL